MRYLSWDEVCSLETFLAEGNDEAIGIELHTGKFTRETLYSNSRITQTLSLEGLNGGDFIALGNLTLRAVVCNRLYYTDHRGWVSHTGTAVTDHKGNDFVRAVLTFNCPVQPLPDEEVLSLKTFLVRDNKRVSAVRIIPGCRGIGGSNTSGFQSFKEEIRDYSLEELARMDSLYVNGYTACALVNDVLHLRYTDAEGNPKVQTLDYRERDCHFSGDSIAYDTICETVVALILK